MRQNMYENRIKHLILTHREMDSRIKELLKSPSYNELLIKDLKKQKLSLKDKIEKLKQKQKEYEK